HGDAEVEQARVAVRGVGLVDAGGPAGKDDAAWLQLSYARGGQGVANDLAEDILFAHPPGGELAVMRAEVEDEDAFAFGRGRRNLRRHGPWPLLMERAAR